MRDGGPPEAQGHPEIAAAPLLLRRVRLVPLGRAAPDGPVDLRIRDGVVRLVQPGLTPLPDERVLDGQGRWAIPGLWDAHVHLQQWARTLDRLDVSGTSRPEDVTAVVAAHVAGLPDDAGLVVGYGQRTATWPRSPTVAELDAVSGAHPVVLISGDAHAGWLNSRALQLLGLPARTGPVVEAEWFAVLPRLEQSLPGGRDRTAALVAAQTAAAARGVVGVVDMEFGTGRGAWPGWVAAGADLLRVRAATYCDGLDDVLAAALRNGSPLPGTGGLVTMGPLKVIFDGSLNTRTAWCCEPYAGDPHWRGQLNLSPDELTALCARARHGGLEVAVHAIGDAAVRTALDAVEAAGATGSLEHVQLLRREDAPRFAALGLRASVQPAHLLDDRDVTASVWPDRQDRCFALRSLLDAGAVLRLGSDAPVARLDPWLAMAAAVHRSADDRAGWSPEQSLTPAEALAASTDGRGTLRAGAPADLVVLDDDPLAPAADAHTAAARLRDMQVAATLLAGRVTASA